MNALTLHCLHGTFQTPVVWTGLDRRLADRLDAPVRVVAEPIEPPPEGGAPAWAAAFCARRSADRPKPAVLLGYSLGGRLAMHALLACPGRWAAAVLVAAHPGGDEQPEREETRRRDAAWAERCRRDPWETLLGDWDGLAVFGGRPNPAPRDPGALGRERCARTFEQFSRAEQADLRPLLAAADLPPVLYVTGGEDARYGALGDELARRVPGLRHERIAGAGHRVPWERPSEFARVVAGFLGSL